MATEGALGRRRAHAIQRIETAAGGALTLPTRSKHDEGVLLVMQLEAIADYFEGLQLPVENEPDANTEQQTEPVEESQGYASMTNAELEALINERELDKGKAHTKPQLIAVLEAADKESEDA